ncbi:lipase 3 [Harpegnathos saltator]|uniref:Lipase n=1 Tax=Harpegnathos saltator TaxID=610380 RepID=E2B563_HARSA|nr:lipase 3 [Harpegnathos saltator]EFN89157.1 Lipase 3 [Harpegnathos saltator]
MALGMRNVLFAFVVITILTEGESQLGVDFTFLQQVVVDYLFPKDPGLVRVRNMDQERGLGGTIVLDFIGLVEQFGYPAEEHDITTEDGYNLQIHRIPGSPQWRKKEKKKIVFMQHGIFASSDSWVIFGPGKDLAFLLADQGYDVWIGNVRGNSYGRSHVNMTVYDRKFWQFSFHEMAIMDLPAIFDYIFNHTGQKSMHYIGHSMGTTMLFILLSMKPEYNAKIELSICFTPVASWKEVSPTFRQIAYTAPVVTELLARYNVYDIFAQCASIITTLRALCHDGAATQSICITILFLIVGADPPQLNTTALPYLLSHIPAGTSVQTLHHFYQNMFVDNFQSFDYGSEGNNERYKQKTPINYDLSKITAPIALFYASNDAVVAETNVLEVAKHLPNVVLIEKVQYESFNHVDFLWGIDANILLYDRVIDIIRRFNAKQN